MFCYNYPRIAQSRERAAHPAPFLCSVPFKFTAAPGASGWNRKDQECVLDGQALKPSTAANYFTALSGHNAIYTALISFFRKRRKHRDGPGGKLSFRSYSLPDIFHRCLEVLRRRLKSWNFQEILRSGNPKGHFLQHTARNQKVNKPLKKNRPILALWSMCLIYVISNTCVKFTLHIFRFILKKNIIDTEFWLIITDL